MERALELEPLVVSTAYALSKTTITYKWAVYHCDLEASPETVFGP